jgi:PAS domain S-box-containing protein
MPNLFSIMLLIAGAAALLVSIPLFRNFNNTVKWFVYANIAVALWAIGYGIELQQSTLKGMLFWVNIEYLGIAFLPALWIVFLLKFIGKDKILSPWLLALLFLDPVVTLLAVWTNPWHHLHYRQVGVDTGGPFPLLAIEPGITYICHTVYFYLSLCLNTIFLFIYHKSAGPIYKKQIRLLLLANIGPWVVNILYLLHIRPYHHLDLTPFAFLFNALLFSIGLLKLHFLDIIPIAREKLIEAMPEGVLVLDRQNRIIDLNPAMHGILASYGKASIGQSLTSLLSQELTTTLLDTGGTGNKAACSLNRDGALHHYEITMAGISRKGQRQEGKILLFRDVTERKQQEEKLQALNQLKDRLFSIISHDLRAPLVNITGMLELANSGYFSEKELLTFIPQLAENVKYTTTLLDNLLIWAKSQLKGEKVKLAVFDLQKMVEQNVALYQDAARFKNICIDNQIKKQVLLFADPDMIQLVVRNLLSNAIKFCQEKDTITISARRNGQSTAVCIADTGIGIKEKELNTLFLPGTYTSKGTKNESGSGLGLLLCKDFIEKNNGQIWVESTSGKGSRFYFTLNNALY